MPTSSPVSYPDHIQQILNDLGVPADILALRPWSLMPEATELVSVGLDLYQREQRLTPAAAVAWSAMVTAAQADGIALELISAFRSVDYQAGIITRKRGQGQTWEQILAASALPGYSEHHTGEAVDIGVPGEPPLTEAFEATPAFLWLKQSAGIFGFRLSFPRHNAAGFIYEPWHWGFHAS